MKMRKRLLETAVIISIAVLFAQNTVVLSASWVSGLQSETKSDNEQKDKSQTPEELKQLYAQSACLLDGDSGRVLYEKNGYEQRPMASTTKILTCIVALENASLDDVVTISAYAAKQPDVQLNALSGEQFKLKNLLFSLMLESHNDSAAAIAEHIGGSVEGFAAMMNQKAMDIGCSHYHFITPNGLDSTDENGEHSITAVDLARILRYCIKESPKRKDFLEITRTASVTFSNEAGSRTFSCNNHNALLKMMAGALTGKTGFTGKAGYCYVGAVESEGRTFIIALLGCGWPNNKSYKWSDTKKLVNYGKKYYQFQDILEKEKTFAEVEVENGIPKNGNLKEVARTEIAVDYKGEESLKLLMREDEKAKAEYIIPDILKAPVKAGDVVGSVIYRLNGEKLKQYSIYAVSPVEKLSFKWCIQSIIDKFLF